MVPKQYHKYYFASTKWQNKLTKIAQNNHARPGPDYVMARPHKDYAPVMDATKGYGFRHDYDFHNSTNRSSGQVR